MKEEQELKKEDFPDVIYEEVLRYLEYATYYELSEIARKAYHLKMEKERKIAKKHGV